MSEHLPKETNYVLNYVYDPQNKPHAVRDAGDKLYSYDAAGNMTGWTHKQNGTRRTITWNEENRVKQIDDNGSSTYFLYDDAGERVVKRGQHGESIYVNRFFSIRNGELGTKSVYAGETRVVSKLVKTPPTNTANSTITGSNGTSGTTTTIPGTNGLDNGRGKKLGIIKRLPDGYQTGINPPVEKDEFFYHGDHLGSSNMITDAYGAVYQHLEYFPYGETWIEEGGSYGGNTPGYKFTGKELDPETGLYYYGARYYDPVLSRWISADPILHKYLDGKPNFGIYMPYNFALYTYTKSNPLIFVDPDGLAATYWQKVGAALKGEATGAFGVLLHVTGIMPLEKGHFTDFGSAVYPNDPELAESFQLGFDTGVVLGAVTIVAAPYAKGGPGVPPTGGPGTEQEKPEPQKNDSPSKKRGPKTDPDAPHNREIRKWGDEVEAEGGTVEHGGGRKKETTVETPGGHKESRRPDIIYRTKEGELKYGNVGKETPSGEKPKREKEALEDLRGTGVPTDYRTYDPKE